MPDPVSSLCPCASSQFRSSSGAEPIASPRTGGMLERAAGLILRRRPAVVAALAGLMLLSTSQAAAAQRVSDAEARCSGLAALSFGPVAHLESASVQQRPRQEQGINWAAKLPAGDSNQVIQFCKIVVTSTPTKDSRITIEAWLPLQGWNKRLLGTGNGGYPTRISYDALAAGLNRGFAVVTTDMGLAAHLGEGPEGSRDSTSVFVNHASRIRDFATRSTHEMTVIGKLLVRAFYGRDAARSYFAGCSTGGMQGMAESQRYPEDYDGILAGDPGANRARLHLGVLWNFLVARHQPQRVIPQDKLQLLNRAALAHCGARPGESFLQRPEACRFDPRPLSCKPGDQRACLTEGELATALAIYDGPRNPRTGEHYLPGLPAGTELGWATYMRAATAPRVQFLGLFQAALGQDFSFDQFDWDRDAQTFIDVMSPQLDSYSADLRAFANRGGKLLIYYGGADALTPVTDITAYYDQVTAFAADLSPTEAVRLRDAFRLFVIPGMDHCDGGSGPTNFDGLGTLIRWREQASAPVAMPLRGDDKPAGLACAYPATTNGGACSSARAKARRRNQNP